VNELLKILEVDTLKEIGSMGASHAANSLSAMIGEKVLIEVPRLAVIPVEEIPSFLGGHEERAAGVFVKYHGDLDATFMILFPLRASMEIAGVLLGLQEGKRKDLSEMETSAIQEIGGIMASHFANALSDFLGFKIIPTSPAFSCDMVGAMMDFLTVDLGQRTEKTILFSTTFHSSSKEIEGYMFLAPEVGSLKKIFKTIKEKYGSG
jgi:chemotaxis protein CheC